MCWWQSQTAQVRFSNKRRTFDVQVVSTDHASIILHWRRYGKLWKNLQNLKRTTPSCSTIQNTQCWLEPLIWLFWKSPGNVSFLFLKSGGLSFFDRCIIYPVDARNTVPCGLHCLAFLRVLGTQVRSNWKNIEMGAGTFHSFTGRNRCKEDISWVLRYCTDAALDCTVEVPIKVTLSQQ